MCFFLLKNAFYVKLHSISRPYTLRWNFIQYQETSHQQSGQTLELSRCFYLTHLLVQHEMCYLLTHMSVITVCLSPAAGVRHAAFSNSCLLDTGLCRFWSSNSSGLQPLTLLVWWLNLKFLSVHAQAQKGQCTHAQQLQIPFGKNTE